MKKKHIAAALIFCLLLSAIAIRKTWKYYGLTTEQTPYTCLHHQDDTLRLAIIGDSWAHLHQPHDSLLQQAISKQTGRPVKVSSYGLCGQTSKEVYLSMFNNEGLRRLLSEGADYCFISVGINDTYKKTGANYFAQHTCMILRFLLQNGIAPILLEIPDYDIAYTYEHQTLRKKLLRQLSMVITGSALDCREDYRQALRRKIEARRLKDSIILIANQHWDMSLYITDRMHLNSRGYQVLDSIIANQLQVCTAQPFPSYHRTSASHNRAAAPSHVGEGAAAHEKRYRKQM